MSTVKREILDLIRRMPEEATTGQILAEVCFRAQVEAGLRDVAAGRTITHAELKRRIAGWRKSAGR